MKARYINPYTGFGFKKIFGEEASLMKADGEPIEKIVRYTGLSEEEIRRL